MPFNQRLKIFEAIKGSSIHQSLATPSSQAAMARCQVLMMMRRMVGVWRCYVVWRRGVIVLCKVLSVDVVVG